MPADASGLVAAADALGQHALPAFLGALVVLAIASGVVWRLVRGPTHAFVRSDDGPMELRLLLTMAAGFVLLLAVAASAFAWIAQHLTSDSAMVRADHALSDAIDLSVPTAALHAFAWLTHLGDPIMLAVLCVAFGCLLWRQRHRTLALAWVLAVGGNAVLNKSLKHVFERARPVYETLVAPAQGYSFPSGHTSGAMVAYGMLAYLAVRLLPTKWHGLVVVSAAMVVFTTACSRIFLHAHFASDVMAGLVSGSAWLTVCIVSAELTRRLRRTRPRTQEQA